MQRQEWILESSSCKTFIVPFIFALEVEVYAFFQKLNYSGIILLISPSSFFPIYSFLYFPPNFPNFLYFSGSHFYILLYASHVLTQRYIINNSGHKCWMQLTSLLTVSGPKINFHGRIVPQNFINFLKIINNISYSSRSALAR